MEVRKRRPDIRGPYRRYEAQDLTEAYRAVLEENISVESAAKKFAVPVSTLKDRVRGRVSIDTTRSGPRTVFTQEQEALLARHLIVMGEVGYGYSRQETLNLASDYAFHLKTRDQGHRLGYDWFYGFISRWPDLKVVKPRSLEAARAKCATEAAISNYFQELEKIMDKYHLTDKPHRIYNIDEKGLSSEHKPPKIVAGRNYKVQAVTSGKSKTITLIGCVNATGQQVPPFFIFPGKRMLEPLLDGASAGADGTMTESGWSNSDTFIQYLKEHLLKFLPARNSDSYVLVLYDGHKSHVTIPLIEWAIQEHIVLFVLPPHCSHILQPLDVACYGPLEKAWNAACHAYLKENGGKIITRYDVCKLASKVYTLTLTPSNIQAAFQKSGVYPFNPSAIPAVATAPSTAFANPASESEPEPNPAAERFLQEKGGQILKNVQAAKMRKTLSKVVAGKAITEPDVVNAVKAHMKSQKPKKSSTKPAKKKAKTTALPESQVPGPSGVQTQQELSQHEDFDSEMDTQNSDDEPEKCVVCGHFYVRDKDKFPNIFIVNWGRCELCEGWVHLSFCSPIRVLRRGDKFLCPKCS